MCHPERIRKRSDRRRRNMSKRISRASMGKAFQAELLECRRLMATISGVTVWDMNNNNVGDGLEPIVAGATVYADYNNNGVREGFEPQVISDSFGSFTLTVMTGTYNLREIAPTDYFSTYVRSVTVPSSGTALTGQNMFNAATLYQGGIFGA